MFRFSLVLQPPLPRSPPPPPPPSLPPPPSHKQQYVIQKQYIRGIWNRASSFIVKESRAPDVGGGDAAAAAHDDDDDDDVMWKKER